MTKIEDVLAERGGRYGKFSEQAATSISLSSKIRVVWQGRNVLPSSDVLEAVNLICVKLSRIAHGDPDYEDNWRDIAGYATLVADRLLQDQKEGKPGPQGRASP